MNIYISGEQGFIAKNLIAINREHNIVNQAMTNSFGIRSFCNDILDYDGEIDFVATPIEFLKLSFIENKVDLVIHNGAIVGTDVCGLNPRQAVVTNVMGTYNLALICKELNIPMIYIGTTVIYDTYANQHELITEKTKIQPRTLYASTKYEGELIVEAFCEKSRYCIIRPLFCYGGIGDMNSLISKISYAMIHQKQDVPIFLDPSKMKDYMHIIDFCLAVWAAVNNKTYLLNEDYNVSNSTPMPTMTYVNTLMDFLNRRNYNRISVNWLPEQDYLGNHLIDSSKFRIAHKHWLPSFTIAQGIHSAIEELLSNREFNPLAYLESEKFNVTEIKKHYN